MNREAIYKAKVDWESFLATLSRQEQNKLERYQVSIDCNNLLACIASGNSLEFDLMVHRLPNRYLYDEEMIPFIYDFYIKRDLHDIAYEYVQKAENYYTELKKVIPINIQEVFDSSVTKNLLIRYRSNLERIPGLMPADIAKIIPDVLNDKRNLNLFVLNEFVQAARVLCEKIEGVKQITHENRFNDLFIATLRLRFPFYGWSLHDQSRLGTSTVGADAGSADIIIQDRGAKNFAVFEALILRGNKYTQDHVLKVQKYVGSINRYYIVVYHTKPSINFDANWSEYKNDVLSTAFPSGLSINVVSGFIDLEPDFTDVKSFKIAKTLHAGSIEMFHLMINLGS